MNLSSSKIQRYDKNKIQNNKIEFLSSSIVPTTGIKGTKQNINGVFNSLRKALDKANLALSDLDRIRVNEAAPVIGDVAMETITETIITESTMIGHNPNTPGGQGVGVGVTALITDLEKVKEKEVIVVVPEHVNFEFAAKLINHYNSIFNINGAIVKNDDGVLINNRLDHKIPIVDEVTLIDKVPIGMLAAIEVAPIGKVIEVLSNPYGIATLFNLTRIRVIRWKGENDMNNTPFLAQGEEKLEKEYSISLAKESDIRISQKMFAKFFKETEAGEKKVKYFFGNDRREFYSFIAIRQFLYSYYKDFFLLKKDAQLMGVIVVQPSQETYLNSATIQMIDTPQDIFQQAINAVKKYYSEASFKKIEEGDILTGTVISVDEKEVTVDLKYYAEGIIPAEDYSREPGFSLKDEVHPGDEVSATVIRTDDGQGNILLSRVEAADVLAWDKLQELKESGEILDVDGRCGGYNLQWAWSSGFIAGCSAAIKTE